MSKTINKLKQLIFRDVIKTSPIAEVLTKQNELVEAAHSIAYSLNLPQGFAIEPLDQYCYNALALKYRYTTAVMADAPHVEYSGLLCLYLDGQPEDIIGIIDQEIVSLKRATIV